MGRGGGAARAALAAPSGLPCGAERPQAPFATLIRRNKAPLPPRGGLPRPKSSCPSAARRATRGVRQATNSALTHAATPVARQADLVRQVFRCAVAPPLRGRVLPSLHREFADRECRGRKWNYRTAPCPRTFAAGLRRSCPTAALPRHEIRQPSLPTHACMFQMDTQKTERSRGPPPPKDMRAHDGGWDQEAPGGGLQPAGEGRALGGHLLREAAPDEQRCGGRPVRPV